ncbi:MAG: hypothetical protein ACC650_01475 [Gammaproteobacteria bacterium]
MEEDEYKSTYNELASVRCVFEKALTNNQAKCCLSRHFCLADREGYSCEDAGSSMKCSKLLEKLRKKSTFVLKLHNVDGPLPHNMEIRVQVGGVIGLAKLLTSGADNLNTATSIDNINGIIDQVIKKYGSLERLPYSEIIQSVEQFQGRRRRQR